MTGDEAERLDAAREALADQAAGRVARWRERMPRRYQGDWPMRDEVVFWAGQVVAAAGHADVAELVPNLWLAGNVGNGKTGNVWKLGELLYANGWAGGIEIVTGPALFEMVAPPVDFAGIRRLCAVDLLVLDDIDAAEVTDWMRQHLYTITSEREQERPTILTSNAGDLAVKVGDRVASRLQPVARVLFDGRDYRRPA